ncbi:MAG: sulfate permease [Actinomycetota bacterium]
MRIERALPPMTWLRHYRREDLRPDLAAGLTVGAMLVPQAMAYALLAGLPPAVGLYAAIVPVLAYALLGTSRQLAVGPVAMVSLLTATALGPLVAEGSAGYVSAAALLALLVGLVHLVMGIGRLGFIVNLLSHSVLVGFTAAAAIIIGFSQVKHLLGVTVPRADHFHETVADVAASLGDVHSLTLLLGASAVGALLLLRRYARPLPEALVVVVASILAVEVFDLESRGVRVVGDIPDSLPAFGLPDIDGSLLGSLTTTAIVITIVGFMESIAVAKVYARRHRYDLDPNQELIGLGAANVAAGLSGGYPVTGGFSRTAVNDSAGARTPLASVVTASVVLFTILLLTPLLRSLPNAALGAIIVVAVAGLIDAKEIRHILAVKPTDGISIAVAFVATLVLGIEIGIGVAVVASLVVVFTRMARPHAAELGRIEPGVYRNLGRFPDAERFDGIRIVRVDAALSFVNAAAVRRLALEPHDGVQALVVDASGMNDLDATGAETLREIEMALADRGVALHLAEVKGPVRDVLARTPMAATVPTHRTLDDAIAAVGAIELDDRTMVR